MRLVKPDKVRSVVLISGGLDSATMLAEAVEKSDEVIGVHYNYGQPTEEIELEKAKKLAEHYGIKLYIKDIHDIIAKGGLTDSGKDFTVGTEASGFSSGFVPQRNLLLLTITGGMAEQLGFNHLYIGLQGSDCLANPEISWEWLAGFFEGGGSTSKDSTTNKNYDRYTFTLSNLDEDLLVRIKCFLEDNLKIKSSIDKFKSQSTCTLRVWRKEDVLKICSTLAPYIRCGDSLKVERIRELGIEVSADQDISWEWLAGFWEADGSICHINKYKKKNNNVTSGIDLIFTQKDRGILEKIQTKIGGNIRKSKIWYDLRVYISKKNVQVLNNIRRQIRTGRRAFQIDRHVVAGLILLSEYKTFAPYPDCTEVFRYLAEALLNVSAQKPIKIIAPLLPETKRGVLKKAVSLGVPLEYTYSCYKPINGKPCGKCNACIERVDAFKKAEIKDPAYA